MKKYLIRTVLVLAAITACNKEIDTPAPIVDNGQEEVTPGKITLTFTAAIGDETRTAYDDEQKPDQKARWVIGDKITVCVSNGDENNPVFKLFDFTATTQSDNNMIFSGEVVEGYTTIVSGIYPANDVYKGESMSTYFGNDGSVIGVNLPDTYDLDTANDTGRYIPMVGEMVHDNDNNTDTFTFHHICGALKIEIIDIFDALTFTTNNEAITGSFSLSGGRIATAASSGPSTVTFNYGRLSTNIANQERGNRTFYIPVPDCTLTAGAQVQLKKNTATVYEKTTSTPIVFSNKIQRMSALKLNTPAGWSISLDTSEANPKITYTVPSYGNQYYIRTWTTLNVFERDYHGSVAEWIENRVQSSGNSTLTASSIKALDKTFEQYLSEGSPKVYLMAGVDKTGYQNRKTNLNYCKVVVVPELPTEAFNRWIGTWTVVDSQTSPKTSIWKISSRIPNLSYNISGIGTNSDITCEALFDSNSGDLIIQSQELFWFVIKDGEERYISLYGQVDSSFPTGIYDIMHAQFNDQNYTSATLSGYENFNRYYFAFYVNGVRNKSSSYGIRYLPSSMTKQ